MKLSKLPGGRWGVRSAKLLSGTALAMGGSLIALSAGAAPLANNSWNMYSSYGNYSYTVAYHSSLGEVLNHPETYGYTLTFDVTVGGRYNFGLTMDTGSTGIVVSQPLVRDLVSNGTQGWVYYNSSGLLLTGFFSDTTVAFNATSGSSPAVAELPILVATASYCILPNSANPCNPDFNSNITTMMGVGFDRNTMGFGAVDPTQPGLGKALDAAPVTPSSLNPFLNITEMQSGAMRAGYILTPNGVQLGLTGTNTAAVNGQSFAYGQLLPISQSAGGPQVNNWQAIPVVITINGSAPQSGSILMDTGVPDGFLVLPDVSKAGIVQDHQVKTGVPMVIDLIGSDGKVGYSFTVGTENPQIPSSIVWVDQPGGANFFNSSLHTYTAFNVLYDAEGGFVGIQLNGYMAGTDAYVTPMLVANGLLQPMSSFDTNLPVLLTGAATISTQYADASFLGDVTGAGSLTVTGPGTVTLAGANTYAGGTFVQQGTLALTGTLSGSLTIAAGAAFTSAGGYMVAAGASLTNAGSFASSSTEVPLYNLGSIVNSGTITSSIGNEGTLTNSGMIFGSVANVGTMSNNGLVVGTLTNAGVLTGWGGAVNLVMASGGLLTPAGAGSIGTFNVLGTLSTAHGSTLALDVGAGGASDQIVVGTAAILGGGIVSLNLGAGAGVGTTYTLLTADALSGTFDGVVSSNPLLTGVLTYGADDVTLTLLRSGVPLASYAQTPNERNVAMAADTLDFGNPLSQALIPLSGNTAAAAYKALSGEAYATTSGALASQSILVRNAVMDRAREPVPFAPPPSVPLNYAAPASAGPFAMKAAPDAAPVPGNAFWTEAFGAWGNIDGNSNAASASTSIGGFLVGFEGTFANAWRFGFATGYSASTISVANVAASTSADTVHAAVYGGGMVDALALRFGAAYAWSDMSSSRTVAFPGLVNQLTADYSARTAQLFGEVAYPVALGTARVEPFAGLAYVNVDTGSFSETGGIAALSANGGAEAVTYGSLGARGAIPLMLGAAATTLKGSLAWQHAFGDVTPESTFAFTGSQPFTVTGAPIAQDAALVEAGVDVAFTPAMTLSVFYSGQLAQNAQENMVKGGFSLKF